MSFTQQPKYILLNIALYFTFTDIVRLEQTCVFFHANRQELYNQIHTFKLRNNTVRINTILRTILERCSAVRHLDMFHCHYLSDPTVGAVLR